MNRVDLAIQAGRCVLAIGRRCLMDAEVQKELRYRPGLLVLSLGGESVDLVRPVSAESMYPITQHEGGVLVLVEPETGADSAGLSALGSIVDASRIKPRLVIAARAFNPFLLPPSLRMLKMEQEKARARDFLGSLPTPSAPVAPVVQAMAAAVEGPVAPTPAAEEPASRKARTDRAPRVVFAGRVEETDSFRDLLSSGGPIALLGSPGVGKRWFIEHVLEGSPLVRAPDLHIGWGAETDTTYARLAAWCASVGDPRLAEAWDSPDKRPTPAEMAALTIECLKNTALENAIIVIRGMETRMREDGTFHRNGRLEMLLTALLTESYAARIVFPLVIRPTFYREGMGAGLRVFELGGLKGRDLHDIFEACRFGDAPRDSMGEVYNLTWGHPMTTRICAITAREADDPIKQLGDRKMFRMESIHDLEPLQRHLRRRIDKLGEDLRRALILAAHFRYPASADALQAVGVDRAARVALLSQGLLDTDPKEVGHRFYVHGLVKDFLPRRETQELEVLEQIAEYYAEGARKADGIERLALLQESNRYFMAARRPQRLQRTGHFDNDPILESVRGLLHTERPFLAMAEERLNRVGNSDPANAEAWLLRAEIAYLSNAPVEAVAKIYLDASRKVPTPEIFHNEATWQMARVKRGDVAGAIDALKRGCAAFPDNGRMRRRLAGLLVQDGQLDDAIVELKVAMDLEPMMPDSYSLLGSILVDRGPAFWPEAAQHLQEASRLAPDDPVHLTRIGRHLRLQGLVNRSQRDELWQKAEACLENAIKLRRRHGEALKELAILLLDSHDKPGTGDLDRVGWLLNQAEQIKDGPDIQTERARLLARTGQAREAEELLNRIVKRDPRNFYARAALAEALYSRGQVFAASATYQRAQEDAPPNAPERTAFEVVIDQLRVLIESGAAIEMQKKAEEEEMARALVVAPVASSALGRRPEPRERRAPAPSARVREPAKPGARAPHGKAAAHRAGGQEKAAPTDQAGVEPPIAEPADAEPAAAEPADAEPAAAEPTAPANAEPTAAEPTAAEIPLSEAPAPEAVSPEAPAPEASTDGPPSSDPLPS
jgi:tetratricopeptide (TPR) repeat protein